MNKSLTTLLKIVVASATLAAAGAQAQLVGDINAGLARATMCMGCHGIPDYRNSFPEIHRVPMISGQSEPYIFAALQAYQKGERRHPTMRGIAGGLSEQDMANLAAFYAQHNGHAQAPETPPRMPNAVVAGLLERGACISCHGANFSSPTDPSWPKIGGQHADYLFVAMRSYWVEESRVIGRTNPMMRSIVAQFTLQELRLMANYIATVPGELATIPPGRLPR
jgi:cytochrome c553